MNGSPDSWASDTPVENDVGATFVIFSGSPVSASWVGTEVWVEASSLLSVAAEFSDCPSAIRAVLSECTLSVASTKSS